MSFTQKSDEANIYNVARYITEIIAQTRLLYNRESGKSSRFKIRSELLMQKKELPGGKFMLPYISL